MNLLGIIEAKYGNNAAEIEYWPGGLDPTTGKDEPEGERIFLWNLPDPQPTITELQQWGADNQDLILEPIRQSLRTQAEETFYRLASEKTGEPINALIIQEWQAKELLAKQWVAEGKPEPTAINEYLLAYYEANSDPLKSPEELMETWLINATNWRQLNVAYIAWRQSFRAKIKVAKDEKELEALRGVIESELRALLKI